MSEKKRELKKILRKFLLGADGQTRADSVMEIIWSQLREESEEEGKEGES